MQWRFDVARCRRGWHACRLEILVYLLIFLVTTALWWPAIRHGLSIANGDSLEVSLPMLSRLWAYLRGGPSPMWVPQIYGGHPLFAEGQGAFLSPLTLLVAICFKPLLGLNMFQYFGMLLMAAGTMQLCKALRLSVWASGIAALGTLFAATSLDNHNNMTIVGSLYWVPWWLWAVERWLRCLRIEAALLAASMLPLMIFSGYPAVVHGALLFAAIRVVPICVTRAGRRWCRPRLKRLLVGACVIAIVGLGLSAVQLLPTLELARWSHRHDGTGLTFFINDLNKYIQGMLFPLQNTVRPLAGNALVVMLALWAPIVYGRRGALLGYVAGTLLMLILGQGPFYFLFKIIYQYGLIPGLHFFRITFSYNGLGVLGMSVLAGFATDGLARWWQRLPRGLLSEWLSYAAICGVAVLVVAFMWIEQSLQGAWLSYSSVLLVLAGLILAWLVNGWKAVPPMVFGVMLLFSNAANRYGFHFFNMDDLISGSVLSHVPETDPRDRRVIPSSLVAAYTLFSVNAPGLAEYARRSEAADGGQAPLITGDWSFHANLALKLANHALLEKAVDNELAGHATAPLGLRLIDILAIRYAVADWPGQMPALTPMQEDAKAHVAVLRNDHSRGFYQAYNQAMLVDSPEFALQRLAAATHPLLVLLHDDITVGVPLPPAATAPLDQVQLICQNEQDDRYAVLTKAPGSFWLFLADANYPGWKAWVDGVPTPVWTAQLGGKAVFVPAGSHRVTLRFRSRTFWYGAYISCATLLLMLLYLGRTHWRQRRFRPVADHVA